MNSLRSPVTAYFVEYISVNVERLLSSSHEKFISNKQAIFQSDIIVRFQRRTVSPSPTKAIVNVLRVLQIRQSYCGISPTLVLKKIVCAYFTVNLKLFCTSVLDGDKKRT